MCTQYFDIPPDENGLPVTEGRVAGSDDCLYLSINVPVLKDTKRKLPVIFLIHGGSYQYGDGLTYGANNKYLLDRDIVFVSINYRLGILGEICYNNTSLNKIIKSVSFYIETFRK